MASGCSEKLEFADLGDRREVDQRVELRFLKRLTLIEVPLAKSARCVPQLGRTPQLSLRACHLHRATSTGPPPLGLFSTTTRCPSLPLSFSAPNRAVEWATPPRPNAAECDDAAQWLSRKGRLTRRRNEHSGEHRWNHGYCPSECFHPIGENTRAGSDASRWPLLALPLPIAKLLSRAH